MAPFSAGAPTGPWSGLLALEALRLPVCFIEHHNSLANSYPCFHSEEIPWIRDLPKVTEGVDVNQVLCPGPHAEPGGCPGSFCLSHATACH